MLCRKVPTDPPYSADVGVPTGGTRLVYSYTAPPGSSSVLGPIPLGRLVRPGRRSAVRHLSLQRLGHEVHEARSGGFALRLLRRLNPDIIVLDHILPGLSGVETVPLLRRAGHLRPIFLFFQLLPDWPKTVTLPPRRVAHLEV